MLNRTLSFAGVVLLLVGLGGGPAWAEDPALAKKLFDEAKSLTENGSYQAALEKLQAAYKAYPADAILATIANRHLDLGQPEEAAEVLSRIQDPKLRRATRKLRKQVSAALSTPVRIRLTADPPEARSSVDGGAPMSLPARRSLSRGKHTFRFEAEGRDPVVVTKVLKGLREVPIFAKLAAPPGTWRVSVEPEGTLLQDVRVVLDGKALALNPGELRGSLSEPRKLTPGRHKVNCLKGVDEFATANVDVVSGQLVVATCKFAAPASGGGIDKDVWAWSAAGGGAVGVILGTVFLASYLNDKATYPAPRYRIDSTKPLASGLLFATGAGLGVVSALLFTDTI